MIPLHSWLGCIPQKMPLTLFHRSRLDCGLLNPRGMFGAGAMIQNRERTASLLRRFRKGAVADIALGLLLIGVFCLLLSPMLGIAAAAASDGAIAVAVCTDKGVEQVTLDAEGNPVPAHASKNHVCACCLAAPDYGIGSALTSRAPLAVPPDGTKAIRPVFPATVYPKQHFLSGRESRAPPAMS